MRKAKGRKVPTCEEPKAKKSFSAKSLRQKSLSARKAKCRKIITCKETKAEKSLRAKSLRQQNHMRRYLNKNLVCEDLKLHRRHVKIHRPASRAKRGGASKNKSTLECSVDEPVKHVHPPVWAKGGWRFATHEILHNRRVNENIGIHSLHIQITVWYNAKIRFASKWRGYKCTLRSKAKKTKKTQTQITKLHLKFLRRR